MVGATRRGLLVAGAGLLVAGCGAEDEPPPPSDAALLAPSLAAALALAETYERAGGRLARELAARERVHARRLRAAGAREGVPVPQAPAGPPLQAALALEQAALRAHVGAVGLVRGQRALVAELLADDAAHAARLRAALGLDVLTTAFPDGRDA